jgi:hypothetical protein
MPPAPLLPFRIRGAKPQIRPSNPQPDRSDAFGSENDGSSVEIVSPDGYSTALLMKYVSPWFPAEVIRGDGWTVRVQTPAPEKGEEWVFEALALIERWLDAVPLPCANVRYCGSSYLIRASRFPEFGVRDTDRRAPEPAA